MKIQAFIRPSFDASGTFYSFLFLLITTYLTISVECVRYWKRLGPVPKDLELGQSCRSSLECLLFIPHSHCDWNQRVCTCQPYNIQFNNTICLPASLLEFGCSINQQCTLKVPNSECTNGLCQCKTNFLAYRRDKCLPPAKVNDYCLNDQQCALQDKFTYCKYIIPRIYGKCKCPNNYVLNSNKKCLPMVGQKCELDQDCNQLTPNSFCSNKSFNHHPVCTCIASYKLSENKTICEPTLHIPSSTETSNNIINNIALEASSLNVAVVSLGKTCSSTFECQNRDQYSACVNGTCECISKSSRCSSKNSECHKDTFQCRNGNCISWKFVCDKIKHCEDGSDENSCQAFKCSKEAFQCGDGTCLSRNSVCNGRWECPDGSDEARCYKGISCDKKSFKCKSGQCLPQYAFCNAVTECIDGSDELESVCEHLNICPKGTFQCNNKKCRSTAVLCDGINSCGDNSDEDKCKVCYCEKPLNY